MKVKEKNSNRRCEVHLYSLGSTKPLDEFGEYVDPNDGAVCCFVPVEERQKIKIGGKLRGTTTTIQCDVLVDGICRKAVMYSGKAMTVEKVKKISVEKFLFSSTDGVIESNLVLKPIDEAVLIQENATITLGTIELRVYVLRHLEDKHALRDVPTYYEREGDGHDANEPVGFKSIKPDFTMTHEENRPILDNRKAKAEQRKMKSARPGNEAWAVFRFHYRDGDPIDELLLDCTFDCDSPNANTPTHELNIKELPGFEVGPKGKVGDDEGASTHASSLAPSAAGIQAEATYTGFNQAGHKTATPATAAEPSSRSSTPQSVTVTPEDIERLQRFNLSVEKAPSMTPPATPAKRPEGCTSSVVIETVEPAQEASTHDEKATEPAVESTPEVTMGVQNPVYTPLTVQPAPATPVKRPAEFTIPPPPIAKRIKYIDTPVLAPPVFKCSPTSPSPTPSQLSSSDGMGSLLSTLRTRLTNAQKKTAGFREKQKQIDEELAPYQAKIAEEMAQIEKKLEIEEADAEEAENTFMASVQMLAEFKKGGTDS